MQEPRAGPPNVVPLSPATCSSPPLLGGVHRDTLQVGGPQFGPDDGETVDPPVVPHGEEDTVSGGAVSLAQTELFQPPWRLEGSSVDLGCPVP